MGSPPVYFFGVRNLPPGGVIPQARAARLAADVAIS